MFAHFVCEADAVPEEEGGADPVCDGDGDGDGDKHPLEIELARALEAPSDEEGEPTILDSRCKSNAPMVAAPRRVRGSNSFEEWGPFTFSFISIQADGAPKAI